MDPIHIFQNGRHFQNGRQPIKKRRKYLDADRLLRSFTNQMKYYNTLLLIMLIIKHLCKKNIYFKYFVNFVLFVRSKGHTSLIANVLHELETVNINKSDV